KRFMQ
ncbi:glycerophosphoryl diester phosphodiesterase family protein, partial [Vibrio parahaemolyticus EKP-021]